MSALLDALEYAGNALAKPGRAVRGAIAGRPDEMLSFVPFSDSLGITDPSRAVWGRDLVRGWGIGSETGNTLAGMGVDLFTDPLLYIGGGLARGAMSGLRGTRALGVGAGEEAGAAINALRPREAPGSELSRLLAEADNFHPPPPLPGETLAQPGHGLADQLAPPPAFATSADELFGFPFSGRAADPYGHGSVFHDMLLDGVSPMERQGAITSAWDNALGRLPPDPESPFRYSWLTRGPDTAWRSQFEKPLLTRLAEGRAFEDAARAGVYGTGAEGSAPLQALREQLGAIESLTNTAVPDIWGGGALIGQGLIDGGAMRPTYGLGTILAGEFAPQDVGAAVAAGLNQPGTSFRDIAHLFHSPSLAPELATAKQAAGNIWVEQMRQQIIDEIDFLRGNATHDAYGHAFQMTPEQARLFANEHLSDMLNPETVAFAKGAVRQYDDVGPMLRELYGYAGQRPPKWTVPKPVKVATPEPVVAPPPDLGGIAPRPAGLDPLRDLAGWYSSKSTPLAGEIPVPPTDPSYLQHWLEVARRKSAAGL